MMDGGKTLTINGLSRNLVSKGRPDYSHTGAGQSKWAKKTAIRAIPSAPI